MIPCYLEQFRDLVYPAENLQVDRAHHYESIHKLVRLADIVNPEHSCKCCSARRERSPFLHRIAPQAKVRAPAKVRVGLPGTKTASYVTQVIQTEGIPEVAPRHLSVRFYAHI